MLPASVIAAFNWNEFLAVFWGPFTAVVGSLGGAFLLYKGGERGRKSKDTEVAKQSANQEFSTAVGIWDQMDERINKEVERRLAPYESRLELIEKDLHEIADAFKAYIVQTWVWNTGGRMGPPPSPSYAILTRLGLGHLYKADSIEDTLEVPKEPP